jgi:putative SOS response-associated peptidase YedK
MCFHNALSKKAQEVANRFHAEPEIDFEPIFHGNGFTFPQWPVITSEEPEKIRMFNWGLIPHWVKNVEDAKKIRAQTLNAKSETVFEKPAFRSSIRKYRCFVISTGFFEWQDFKKKKYPYYIRLKDTEIFALAGIYSKWIDKSTGEIINSFAILTTMANPLLARIHNSKERMPVILPPETEGNWLAPELPDETIRSFFNAIDENRMEAHTIGKLITSRTENSNVPGVQDKCDYPELDQLIPFSKE